MNKKQSFFATRLLAYWKLESSYWFLRKDKKGMKANLKKKKRKRSWH